MKLRTQILLFFFLFALTPLLAAVVINLPLVLERMELFYHKAHLQNLRADFRDLDQHLASRDEMVRLLAKLPEPGAILGDNLEELTLENMDLARTQYTHWINQIFQDQLDIVQIVFYDMEQRERFWLDRDKVTQQWQPTVDRPSRPPVEFLSTALGAERSRVAISPISLDPEAGALDPRRFMNLRLMSPIHRSDGRPLGGVMIVIDVGGMARYYRNTLWVHDNGEFLQHSEVKIEAGNAFERYRGLAEIFSHNKPALWEGNGQQIMWLPMFQTEKAGALWVGRQVDPSPIAEFRTTLTIRVLSIVFALALAIWFLARLVAARADKLGHELTDGIQKVLETEEPVEFHWKGPQELKKLGQNLTRLSQEHGRNTRDLRAHARELEASNRYKSEFLANVSHELRTPLNSILLLSKMLAESDSGLKAEQSKQARVINEAATDLRSLIDNILDLSRIEARKTSFSIERIDLVAMLNELKAIMQPQFDAKGITLSITAPEPMSIVSDSKKIRQIIKNFLANAVKFTEQGTVDITLNPSPASTAEEYAVAIRVQDTGIGIAQDKQRRIFEAFNQADGSTNRRYGGTGLGLTISQQLAKLLGGCIELESSPGSGSTFSLLLPESFDDRDLDADQIHHETRVPDTPAETEQTPSINLSGHHILLVNCDMKNLVKLTPILERTGLRISAADDTEEALEVIQEESPVSLALVNTAMTGADGYDTIRQLVSHHPDLAIIAMSPEAGEDAEVPEGVVDRLELPIDIASLEQLLINHLTDNKATREA